MGTFRFLFILACVAFVTPLHHAAGAPLATDGSVRVGDMAPNFTLPLLNGTEIRLADHLDGKPVLLVFWSYFCFPCQKEMPDIQQVAEEVGPSALDVIGINLDGRDYADKVLPYLEENGITYPNAYDRLTETFFEVAEQYGVVGTPTSFLVDSRGRVRLIHLGRLEPEVLKSLLKSSQDQTFCPEITRPQQP